MCTMQYRNFMLILTIRNENALLYIAQNTDKLIWSV